MHARIAIAIRRDVKYKIIDDFAEDILGVELETTKGPVMFLTCYSPPRRNYIPVGELENKLQKRIPVFLWEI